MINSIVNSINKYFSTINVWQKIIAILFILFTYTLPYGAKGITSVILILIFVFWLISGMPFRNFPKLIVNPKRILLLSFAGLYILYVAGTFYNNELANPNALRIKLPLLAFPLILSLSDDELFSKDFINILKNIFVFGTFTTLIILSVESFISYSHTHDLYEFSYDKFSGDRLHPTYLSMYVVFSFFILFIDVLKSAKIDFLRVIPIVIFPVYLVLLSSKAGILSFMLLLVFVFVYKLIAKDYSRFLLFISLFAFIFSIGLYKTIPTAKKRMQNAEKSIEQNTKNNKTEKTDGTSVRLMVWEEAIKSILQKPLFGHGTGMEKEILLKSNNISSSEHMLELKPDAHNQYLQTAIAIGFLGLALLLYILILPTILSFKYNNIVFLIFLIIISFNFLFESIIERQSGIMFFSFFISLFFIDFNNYSKKTIRS